MATRKNAKEAGPAPKRKKVGNKYEKPQPIPLGTILTDSQRSQWKVGCPIGSGGFGEIYAAYSLNAPVPKQYPYVVKIEPHENGPLFVEKNFYMKFCRPNDIEKYRKRTKQKHLGVPHYVGSGTHDLNGIKHRFLIIPRYGESLESVLQRHERCLPLQAVYRIALQIVDVLEYIHVCGYVHCDVKAANILFADDAYDRVYLVDFGLATKCDALETFKPDPKKKHNGTLEYTSRDAHQGVSTMRGDFEVLAYNLIQWAGGKLPWDEEKSLKDCNKVQHMKEASMGDGTPEGFLKRCFPKSKNPPKPLADFIQFVACLSHNTKPNYAGCTQVFDNALKQLGVAKVGDMGLAPTNKPSSSAPSTSGPLVSKTKSDTRKNVKATAKQGNPLPDTVPNTPETSATTSTRVTRRSTQSELHTAVSSMGQIPEGTVSKAPSGISFQIETPKKGSRCIPGIAANANYSPRVLLVKINIDSNVNLNIETTRTLRKKPATVGRGKGPIRKTKPTRNMRDPSTDEDITLHVSDDSDEADQSRSIFD